MENKMFCFQCQEAANNEGCTISGVCGKNNSLANEMDIFKNSLKVLASESIKNKKTNSVINIFIMEGLFKLITNANFNQEIFKSEFEKCKTLIKSVTKKDINLSYDENSWKTIGVLVEDNEDLRAAKELIITGLMGLAAYHSHAYNLGYENQEIHDFTISTLAKINEIKDLETLIELVDITGEYGIKGMALLDQANTTTFGNPEISKVSIETFDKPGILVSGHDLKDIAQLLEQSKDSGVDIYTHSEMLPTHYYPKLKKYSHLVGNYGSSWVNQKSEFESFNGPILFTTNCIIPPDKNSIYKDKVYTTGNAGHSDFIHIPNIDGKKDFSQIIEHAKKTNPPTKIESGEIIGGFAHSQVFDLSNKLIENIKSGAIRNFIVMAGCDGRQNSRDYYKDFANKLKDDTIILTAGCAKYRYNKLNLKDINGIPRILDAGQCNDSYSLVMIALKLKEVFNLDDINKLPISYNIAWYEQKAVIVLLALLHLNVQNIKLGPTLPAFITPNVADFLVNTFKISTIEDVESDLAILG